jgi:cell division protein FtsI/penicillin-binding protein 2
MARSSSYRSKRIDFQHHDIPTKANRVLHFVLVGLLLIGIRIWHLGVIQYDQKVEESRRPQYKSIIEPATRATIRDRFNLPLAVNKISYQATILYSQIQSIAPFGWEIDAIGKKVKIPKRKLYIRRLAEQLAQELHLEADRVEDLIHAKASFYAQVPFVIKEDLSEKEYYRLKMLEKDWPGIYARHLPKRTYPQGRVGADIIGYMGSINRQEYEKILQDIRQLEKFIATYEQGEEVEAFNGIETISQARHRLKNLEAKAYTIHDYVGKTGIEGVFEEKLRGFYGKKHFYTDSKGNFIRELPGSRVPLSGQRILLTISAELQAYAEELLIQNEAVRVVRKSALGAIKQTVLALKQPWIKGGAIVVMDPQNAELLALASYPRFDPNDFIASANVDQQREKTLRINRWFENESYLANIWDQQQPLERERYQASCQTCFDEKRLLTWINYLEFILPLDSALKRAVLRLKSIRQAVDLQHHVQALRTLLPSYDLYTIFNFLYAGEEHEVYRHHLKGIERQKLLTLMQSYREPLQSIRDHLDPFFSQIPQNYDKVLLVDLSRLIVAHELFPEPLLEVIESQLLETYHQQLGDVVALRRMIKNKAYELFHATDFKQWKQEQGKDFLKEKRKEELLAKKYPKPYLDYFDQEEKRQFQQFWSLEEWHALMAFLTGKINDSTSQSHPYLTYFSQWSHELEQEVHQEVKSKNAYDHLQQTIQSLDPALALIYLKSFRAYEELDQPLLGRYRYLRAATIPLEKHLATAFYPAYGFGYGRSHAYRQAAIQGSLFKLVTAYAALTQLFKKLNRSPISPQELNPLIIVDEVFQQGSTRFVGYTEEGKPIPQLYKGGRLPRSLAHQNNGRVDLIHALEVSSNPYFSLLAGECLDHPNDLSEAAQLFSFGQRTGVDLSAEIAGKVPTDLEKNRTGLYAMAIGQHSLVVTPLQTAVMLATIANGGKVLKPKIVSLTAGKQQIDENDQIICLPEFPHSELLKNVGVDFPLFTACLPRHSESLVHPMATEVKREVFMPEVVRQILLKGLKIAFQRTYQESLTSLTRLYKQHPEAIRQLTEFKNQLIGKTSTSESVENIDLDLDEGTNIYTHVWFGSIVFPQDPLDKNKTLFLFKDEFGKPELVVVVYLRYGGYGKEAAPLAAQMVKKWRELKQKYQKI